MAKLIKCKSCKTKISENAEVCPKCGEPNPKPEKGTSFTTIVFALLIIGFISSVFNTGSTTSSRTTTTAPTPQVPKKPTKAETEQMKKVKEQDVKYFKQSKEVIIEDINLKIQNKDYKEVMNITAKYLSFRGKDDGIIKINADTRALWTKDNKEKYAKQEAINLAKTKIENKKKEKEILKKLKKIPTSDFNQNLKLYKILLSYEPDRKKYKTKVKFYTNQVNKEEAKKALDTDLSVCKSGLKAIMFNTNYGLKQYERGNEVSGAELLNRAQITLQTIRFNCDRVRSKLSKTEKHNFDVWLGKK